jgi:hypothetical protein
MRRHLDDGLAGAAAAALASRPLIGEETTLGTRPFAGGRGELAEAVDRFGRPAQAILDRLLAVTTSDALLSEIVLPYLHELGDRWQRGDAPSPRSTSPPASSAAACSDLRAAGEEDVGPLALLACLPHERTTSA